MKNIDDTNQSMLLQVANKYLEAIIRSTAWKCEDTLRDYEGYVYIFGSGYDRNVTKNLSIQFSSDCIAITMSMSGKKIHVLHTKFKYDDEISEVTTWLLEAERELLLSCQQLTIK